MQRLSAFLTRKGHEYVAVCPELELQTQGNTIDDALDHLWEEVEEYCFEEISPEEIEIDFLGWKH